METHKMTTVVVFGETVGKIMPHFFLNELVSFYFGRRIASKIQKK